jgi:predicted AAA+ superfamily ATPase
MKRYVADRVEARLAKKMVFLAGPRQCGKTTLAKTLLRKREGAEAYRTRYLNWDDDDDRARILAREFPGAPGMMILDEVHKFSRWRNILKGLYDKRGHELSILVTGSARLDHYRKGGDSLQGRYDLIRMHPLSLAEVGGAAASTLKDLMVLGGFPEPFLGKSEADARLWSRQYRTRLVLEDVATLEKVQDIALVEALQHRLPALVGSPLSINALREDLGPSHQTVSRWLTHLEAVYSIFRVYPFGAPKLRAVKKEAKHYHFDWTVVPEAGARFENLVACHLLKWCHYREDTEGYEMELRYFRDVDKREVDFVVMEEGRPILFIEAKKADRTVSPHLRYLKLRFPKVPAWQLTLDLQDDFMTEDGIRVANAAVFLKTLC